jgi:hypothetical protein
MMAGWSCNVLIAAKVTCNGLRLLGWINRYARTLPAYELASASRSLFSCSQRALNFSRRRVDVC